MNPRRLWDDNQPDGYMESDSDYLANNHAVAIRLLDFHDEMLTRKSRLGHIDVLSQSQLAELSFINRYLEQTMD